MVRGGLDLGTGKLAHGQMNYIHKKFSVPLSTLRRYKTDAIKHAELLRTATVGSPTVVFCTSPALKGEYKGRTAKYTEEELHAKLQEMDPELRSRVIDVAKHLDVSTSTVHSYT